jgi:ribosomal protein L17
MTKLIVNVETGETTERTLNKAENDQQKIDEQIVLAKEAEAEAKATARAAILDRLGLTADEAAILLS